MGNSGGTALEFNNVINTTTAGPAPLSVGTLVLNGTVTLNIPTGVFGSQEFPLIQYGSISGSGGFLIGTLPPGVTSVQIVTNLGSSTIDILPVTDVWTGNVNSNWDNSTINWTQFGNPVAFANGVQALFDDSLTSNQTNVNLSTTGVAPGGISFNNNAYNYTLNSANGSSLGGGGFVFKVGSGTATILNSNNFSGGTTRIGGGTLVVANQNAIQGSTLDLNSADLGSISFAGVTTANIGGLQGANNLGLTNASGAALALNVGGAVQNSAGYSGLLSGPGSLAKVGSNTVAIFNGGQTFTGGTVVSNGVLQLGNNNTGPVLPAGLVIASGGTVNNQFNAGIALNQFSGAGTNAFGGALNNSVILSSVVNPGFTGTYAILGGRLQVTNVASLGNPSMIYVGGLSPVAGSSTNG
jgi:autotransporter-associated beta strand protein